MALVNDKSQRILLILLVATLAKVLWALYSVGFIDTPYFSMYGKLAAKHGLAWMYASGDIVFNHTPLTSAICVGIFGVVGDDKMLFGFVFRLLSIIADVFVVLGLMRLVRFGVGIPWWALAVVAGSPVSLMISGYHGNVDPIMTALLFYAAISVIEKRPAICGLYFALSCNLKVVPLMFFPAFFLYWLHHERRSVIRFSLTVFAVLLAGFGVALWEYPQLLLSRVFGYGGLCGSWGVTYWLRQTGAPVFEALTFNGASPEQKLVMRLLKVIVILLVLHISWARRKVTNGKAFFETIARCWIILFVFAPSGSPQYMSWFLPFMAIGYPRWSILLNGAATIYLAVCYSSIANSSFPWVFSSPVGASEMGIAMYFLSSNIPWIAFIALYISLYWNSLKGVASLWKSSPTSVATPPE